MTFLCKSVSKVFVINFCLYNDDTTDSIIQNSSSLNRLLQLKECPESWGYTLHNWVVTAYCVQNKVTIQANSKHYCGISRDIII